MEQINALISEILVSGSERGDRTDTGTTSIFGYDKPLVFKEVAKVFPAINSKTLAWKAMVAELLWFLSGSCNLKDLKFLQFGDPESTKKTIWDDNYENEGKALGYEDGYMGKIYGYHMSRQLEVVMEKIKTYPEDRQLVMSNWQADFIKGMTLPPCHGIHTQFYVCSENKLHLNTTMRSVDVFLGLPFNIASYALMLIIVANMLGMESGNLKMYLVGDVHIYKNHVKQCIELMGREPIENKAYVIPPETLTLEGFRELRYSVDDFRLMDYTSHGKIAAPMAFKKN